MAAAIAGLCAYTPVQVAMWESLKANCARDNLSLAEGAMAITTGDLANDVAEESGLGGLFERGKEEELRSLLYADDDEDDSDASSLRDYDHYKLKTHSFNEYRSGTYLNQSRNRERLILQYVKNNVVYVFVFVFLF
jgi:hypothetical protein